MTSCHPAGNGSPPPPWSVGLIYRHQLTTLYGNGRRTHYRRTVDEAAVVQTVSGPVAPGELGFTLPHEHTFIQLWQIPGRFDYLGQLAGEDVLVDELESFRSHGGRTLVDLTLPGIGRDVRAVARLAERTSLTIVVGTGFYREPYYPPEARIDQRSVESIADEFVREAEEGIDGTGIRAGIIGEIGVDKTWVSAQEERVCRAAGQAQLRTGLAITTHSVLSRVGLAQLALFEAEGADPARVVIGHCDWTPDLNYYLEIIQRGAIVQLDGFGHPDTLSRGLEDQLLSLVLELLHRGHERQLLLSQDVCYTENLKRFGGKGYSYLQEHVIGHLLAAGVPQDVLDQVTIANPARVLTPC
jgi:predicted metal-dependent phosphotriesterase family hydrolase